MSASEGKTHVHCRVLWVFRRDRRHVFTAELCEVITLEIVVTKEEQETVFKIIMRDGVDAGIDAARLILNDKFVRRLLEEGALNSD